MANSIDQAYERFLKLKPDIEVALADGPNESDTRLKVLDRILFEVLEWKYEAVFTEPPTPSGYIDYLLTIGEKRGALIVEAKKAGRLAPATKSNDVMTVALSGPVAKPLMEGVSSTDQRNTYLKPRTWSDGDEEVSLGWVYRSSERGALGALEEG